MSYITSETGPSTEKPAIELVESGFALENADAPVLHRGLNLADMAHVIDLRDQRVIPDEAAGQLLGLLLDVHQIEAEDFPYDPNFGEPYNSREHYFVERLGDVAGWLHAGRPRREAARLALRMHLRRQLIDVVDDAITFVDRLTGPVRPAPRNTHARPDLPPAGTTLDVRALRPVVRLPDPARHPPAARLPGVGQQQPRRCGLCQRQPTARRPGPGRRPARIQPGHRAHPRRHVAGRRADQHPVHRRQPSLQPEQAGRGPRDLVQHRVRLRRSGRPLHPLQHPDAAEAQPLFALRSSGARRAS